MTQFRTTSQIPITGTKLPIKSSPVTSPEEILSELPQTTQRAVTGSPLYNQPFAPGFYTPTTEQATQSLNSYKTAVESGVTRDFPPEYHIYRQRMVRTDSEKLKMEQQVGEVLVDQDLEAIKAKLSQQDLRRCMTRIK